MKINATNLKKMTRKMMTLLVIIFVTSMCMSNVATAVSNTSPDVVAVVLGNQNYPAIQES